MNVLAPQLPQYAEGGYWYVRPVVWRRGARTPGDVPHPFTAIYATVNGTDYAAVRLLSPHPFPDDVNVSAADVVAAAKAEGQQIPFDAVGVPRFRSEGR